MTIVERITASNLDKSAKLVKLWLVAMINYRQPLGVDAFESMQALTDRETMDAISFIGGLSMGAGAREPDERPTVDAFKHLLNEAGDW